MTAKPKEKHEVTILRVDNTKRRKPKGSKVDVIFIPAPKRKVKPKKG